MVKGKKYLRQLHYSENNNFTINGLDETILLTLTTMFLSSPINVKPLHALWTSSEITDNNNPVIIKGKPVSNFVKYGIDEGFITTGKKFNIYEIVPKDDSKILNIEHKSISVIYPSGEVIKKLSIPDICNNENCIDYEKIASIGIDIVHIDYDIIADSNAFGLTSNNDNWYKFASQFYGWDAESSVWLNINAIKTIKKL